MDNLQSLANEVFDAITKNTGESFPHSTVKEAYESFQYIVASKGVVWLVNSAMGSGMSHIGWIGWMNEARKLNEET